jgi:hypothetical protein
VTIISSKLEYTPSQLGKLYQKNIGTLRNKFNRIAPRAAARWVFVKILTSCHGSTQRPSDFPDRTRVILQQKAQVNIKNRPLTHSRLIIHPVIRLNKHATPYNLNA